MIPGCDESSISVVVAHQSVSSDAVPGELFASHASIAFGMLVRVSQHATPSSTSSPSSSPSKDTSDVATNPYTIPPNDESQRRLVLSPQHDYRMRR